MKTCHLVSLGLIALFAVGCAGQDDIDGAAGSPASSSEVSDESPDESPEEVGTVTQGLDTSWVVNRQFWSADQNDINLGSASDRMCVLTRVGGKFNGLGEKVHVYQSNGSWFIGGTSLQPGVHGEATCFAHSKFLANGSSRWNSSEGVVADGRKGCTQTTANAWFGDAATMLTGMSGYFAGGGEWVGITQSPGAFTASSATANSCQYAWMQAYYHSFFAGTPGNGALAKLYGSWFHVQTKVGDAPSNNYETRMAPTGEAMCYLVNVAGEFKAGGGEYVTIEPRIDNGTEYWFLRVRSGGMGSNPPAPLYYISGDARCYLRDQR